MKAAVFFTIAIFNYCAADPHLAGNFNGNLKVRLRL